MNQSFLKGFFRSNSSCFFLKCFSLNCFYQYYRPRLITFKMKTKETMSLSYFSFLQTNETFFLETFPSQCDRRAIIFFFHFLSLFVLCKFFWSLFDCLSNFPSKNLHLKKLYISLKIKTFLFLNVRKCWCFFAIKMFFFSPKNMIDVSQQSASVLCLKLSLAWFLISLSRSFHLLITFKSQAWDMQDNIKTLFASLYHILGRNSIKTWNMLHLIRSL